MLISTLNLRELPISGASMRMDLAARFASGANERAEELYAAKQYVEAADMYAEMFQYGESAALYYNYANALYKSNQIGLAILNYERALRLDPTNEDIKFNLEFVNKMKTDKIEPLEKFFMSEWSEALGRLFTSNQWAYASIISFILCR